ncbi:NTP transferase domain-containing protein [bacterium]|nr:NTP transferase domain-containing protein [bacterium]
MGRPKHLLSAGGCTWLERTVGLLQQVTERTVIVGAGAVPDTLAHLPRLPDAPDAEGPMAGMLAAMRWAPRASWLIAACDLPDLSLVALHWLLGTRAPGVWATVPIHPDSERLEPLLAHYDFRARALLAQAAAEGNFCPLRITSHPSVASRRVPIDLAGAWWNANSETELSTRIQVSAYSGHPSRKETCQ